LHFRAPTQREIEMLTKRRSPTFREANPAKIG
jgi:hypothetical protein